MKLIQAFCSKNPCYTNGRTINPQGLMIHSVGCPQPDPYVFQRQWNSSGANVGVHYICGKGTVLQMLKDNMRAWHCGSGSKGSGNNMYISIEMTEPSTIRYTGGSSFVDNNPASSKAHVVETYNTTVEWAAMMCKKYGFDPMTDIISHKEGHDRGIASNHGDPDHILRKYGLSMDSFRQAVKAKMSVSSGGGGTTTAGELYRIRKSWADAKSQIGAYKNKDSAINIARQNKGYNVYDSKGNVVYSSSSGTTSGGLYRVRKSWADAKSQVGAFKDLGNAKSECNKHAGYSVFDESGRCVYSNGGSGSSSETYVVKVTTDALRIRAGAGTNTKQVGTIRDKGCYTIVETRGNWGKLKSGAGWICLDYTQRV